MSPSLVVPTRNNFLLVETDYFTKWVEVEAFSTIKYKDITRFLWKSIICRFGIPRVIISYNGPQFDSSDYRKFCIELRIRNLYSSPHYHKLTGKRKQQISACLMR